MKALSRRYAEPATRRRFPPRVFDPDTFLETDESKAAQPTDTAIVASFHPSQSGAWEVVGVAGIRGSEERIIVTFAELYATISDTNQGLPDPEQPRQADQILFDGRLWNVIEVRAFGAPSFLYEARLLLAPSEDAI